MDTLLEGALSRVEIPELKKKDFSRWKMLWIEAADVDCNQPEKAAQFELALDQWILSLSPESPRIQPAIAETTKKSNQQSSLNEKSKEVLLSPLLESFVSKGDRFRGSVSSKNRNLSNWASFGYYTGWLLHCDWSQKGRMDTLLEDTLSRVEIPELKKEGFQPLEDAVD